MNFSGRIVHLTAGLMIVAGLVPATGTGSSVHGSDSEEPAHGLGFIPPAFNHPETVARMPMRTRILPARFDWREQSVVTLVQNQGSCGSCYAFAALANFESKLQVAGEGSFNLSENNIKECQWDPNPCLGGHYWMVANHLSKHGTVLESCDPYLPYHQFNCRDYCTHIKTLLDWRVISFNVTPAAQVLKNYIYDQGPIFVAIDVASSSMWSSEFSSYDGSYTLYHPGSDQVNHAVVIVGWDDDLVHAGGSGGWIVKNSWGTSWGGPCGYGTAGGYFTIAYGSANIGQQAAFIYEWQDYDPGGALLYHDEAGYTVEAGYPGSKSAWGCCKYTPTSGGTVERVEFFAIDEMTNVSVYIYDDFDGEYLSNELASRLNLSFEHPGYHSIELIPPLGIEAGDDIYVAAHLTSATFEQPLPADEDGIKVSGSSYRSPDGDKWYEVLNKDLGIRARVVWDDTAPDAPWSFGAVGSDTTVTLSWVNPLDEDFEYTLVVYSTTASPPTPEGGTPLENGSDGKFYNSPGSSDGFVHTRLDNDTTYYYSAFAADMVPNYSVRSAANATRPAEVQMES